MVANCYLLNEICELSLKVLQLRDNFRISLGLGDL